MQLGIVCDELDPFGHSDRYVESGAKSNQYQKLDDNGEPGERWTCAEGADFPANVRSVQVVKEVSIETDDTWATSAPPVCLEQVSDVQTASPVNSPVTPTAPVPVPVVARESSSDSDAGAIVGGVLGSIAIIMLAAVLIVLMKLQRSRSVGENTNQKDVTSSEDDKEVELAVRNSINA